MGSDSEGCKAPHFAYSEILEERYPYYLAMGMSYAEYWHDDVELVKYYREAAKIKRDMLNERLWLQGLYIYDALGKVSPLFRAMSGKAEAEPYPEKPYEINGEEQESEKVEEKPEKNKLQQVFEMWAVNFNQRLQEKEVEANGR